jgi:transposase-like protein
MSSKRYTEEFKIEAVKQVTECGGSASEVARRLGVNAHSLYAWIKKYGKGPAHAAEVDEQQSEINRLRKELKRVTEERGPEQKHRPGNAESPKRIKKKGVNLLYP